MQRVIGQHGNDRFTFESSRSSDHKLIFRFSHIYECDILFSARKESKTLRG